MHAVSPRLVPILPVAHTEHVFGVPEDAAKRPRVHFRQRSCPLREDDPAGHFSQVPRMLECVDALAKRPAEQFLQEFEETS